MPSPFAFYNHHLYHIASSLYISLTGSSPLLIPRLSRALPSRLPEGDGGEGGVEWVWFHDISWQGRAGGGLLSIMPPLSISLSISVSTSCPKKSKRQQASSSLLSLCHLYIYISMCSYMPVNFLYVFSLLALHFLLFLHVSLISSIHMHIIQKEEEEGRKEKPHLRETSGAAASLKGAVGAAVAFVRGMLHCTAPACTPASITFSHLIPYAFFLSSLTLLTGLLFAFPSSFSSPPPPPSLHSLGWRLPRSSLLLKEGWRGSVVGGNWAQKQLRGKQPPFLL